MTTTTESVKSLVSEALKSFGIVPVEIPVRDDGDRAEWIRQADALQQKRNTEWVSNSVSFNRANLDCEKLRKQLAAAELDLARASSRRGNVDFSLRSQRTQVLGRLFRSAPTVLDMARDRMIDEMEKLRKKGPDYAHRLSGRQDASGNAVKIQFSNETSFRARLTAMGEAVREFEEMKHTVATELEALTEINRIKAAIPEVGEPEAERRTA